MLGAILGDIAGSRFEWNNYRAKDFELFTDMDFFTDDSVMTIAVAKALHECLDTYGDFERLPEELDYWMHTIGKKYPHCGYGGRFYSWILEDQHTPYHSFGNGAGMRTAECGWIAGSLDEALQLAKVCAEITHDHPEGIRGAQAITACIYLARQGKTKEEIRDYVNEHFYRLDFTLDEIRPYYTFNETCQESCPQAIEAFLESGSFTDALRNAVSIGGDSDTIAAMTGSIAEAYYGLPDGYRRLANSYLDRYLRGIVKEIKEG